MTASSTRYDNDCDSFLSKAFLDLEMIDSSLYRSKISWKYPESRHIYGGQTIGQAMIAASMGIPDDQHLHSFHSYFLHRGNRDFPILYHVENIRNGKTYMSRAVRGTQNGKTLFTMMASFKTLEYSPLPLYQLPMPAVPSFNDVPDYMESLQKALEKGFVSEKRFLLLKQWSLAFPIEVKWVDQDSIINERRREPWTRLWFRAAGHISEEANHNIHKCCIGYMTDLYLLHTSLIQHSPSTTSKVLQASLDHCMWFHAPCRADEWMLYEVKINSTGDGRTFCHGLIWDQHGTLVITVNQEGVHRVKSRI